MIGDEKISAEVKDSHIVETFKRFGLGESPDSPSELALATFRDNLESQFPETGAGGH